MDVNNNIICNKTRVFPPMPFLIWLLHDPLMAKNKIRYVLKRNNSLVLNVWYPLEAKFPFSKDWLGLASKTKNPPSHAPLPLFYDNKFAQDHRCTRAEARVKRAYRPAILASYFYASSPSLQHIFLPLRDPHWLKRGHKLNTKLAPS